MRKELTSSKLTVGRRRSRASSTRSLARRKYSDPLAEMTDLSGMRIVLYYGSDVDRVNALIDGEFVVDHANSLRKSDELDPDRFGYISDHFVVSLSDERAALPEWRAYCDMRAEIQVRTALQHAWAAIDHKLRYKRAQDAPRELRRQLFRMSALLEVADDQFESLRRQSEALDARNAAHVQSGDLDLQVDASSVEAYLRLNDRARLVDEAGRRLGYRPVGEMAEEAEEEEDELGVTQLLRALEVTRCSTIDELDEILSEHAGDAEVVLQAVREAFGDTSGYASRGHLVATILYAASPRSVSQISRETKFAAEYYAGLRAARDKLREDDS